MTTFAEGLKSDAIRQTLAAALAGKPATLETLLCRHGGGLDRLPNLRLAAAFAVDVAAAPGRASRLLAHLGQNDAAPDTPEVFLPMAAAFGWVAMIEAGKDAGIAWAALAELAADERAHVRLATREATMTFGRRGPDSADQLLAAAVEWLEAPLLDIRFGAAAVMVEVLCDRHVLSCFADPRPALDYVSRVIDEAVEAPRSAGRSAARRRLLGALPGALAGVPGTLRGGDIGMTWFCEVCAKARLPDVRAALSAAILLTGRAGLSAPFTQRLREALEGSAKPPRDPSRIRPGSGRGKVSKKIR